MSHYLSIRGIGQPIAYFPQLAIHLGCIKAAVFLGQMIYWHNKTENPLGVYKTAEEITQETGLSYKEQLNARKKLEALDLITETYKRLDHRLYFKFNIDAFDEWFGKVVLASCTNGISRTSQTAFREEPKGQVVIQKNTTEITTENISIYKAKFDFAKSLLEKGANQNLVSEYMEVRAKRKATNSETAFKNLISEQQKSGLSLNQVLEICVTESWKGFKAAWLANKDKSLAQKPKSALQATADQWAQERFEMQQASKIIDVNQDQVFIGGRNERF